MSALELLRRAVARAPVPLTVRQLAVLLYLGANGERGFRRVRADLGLSAPQLTRAVDALVRAKLAARSVFAGDRRAPLLALTEAGQAFVAKLGDA